MVPVPVAAVGIRAVAAEAVEAGMDFPVLVVVHGGQALLGVRPACGCDGRNRPAEECIGYT